LPNGNGVANHARWYLVVHVAGGTHRSLGRLAGVPAHPATLAPFVSRLLLDGAAGEVVLVEEATRRVVVRHDLGQGPLRTGSRGPRPAAADGDPTVPAWRSHRGR